MARKSANEDNSLVGLLEFALGELDSPIRRGNRLTYVPYPKQQAFHESPCLGRYVAGANRAGKSDAEVMEAIWWCTDTHPFLKRPEAWGHGAIRGRFVVVDIVKGVEDIILPKLKRWCATSDLVNGSFNDSWDNRTLTFTFRNGSTIQFLTHGMDLDKHGGVPLHFVFFDEIPPLPVFNENMMRLVDFNGFWVIAATAVGGMGWTYDYIWEPWENGEIDYVECFQLKQSDNPHLQADEQERGKYYLAMDEAERHIREEGAFVAKSGLVFPNFSKKTHVLEEPLQYHEFRSWAWYSSVDFGWNNPTAWLWHAVAPDGRIYTFAEAYGGQTTTDEWARIIHGREAAFGKQPEVRVGDPAGNQKQMNTGTSVISEYARRGIYIGTEGIPKDPMIGIEKMQQYLAIQNLTGWGRDRPTWMISPNCKNLIRELTRLRWASYESDKKAYDLNKKEEVHKRDDHCLVAGTLVETDQGPKPIESVEVGDRVLTRQGYREVWSSRITSYVNEVYELVLSTGHVVRGTGNHRISTNRGWVRLDSLQYSDTVTVWDDQRLSSTQESDSEGIQILRTGQSVATTYRESRTGRRAGDGFTKRFTDLKSGIFPMDGTSIIETSTLSTTTRTTFLGALQKSIKSFIEQQVTGGQGALRTWSTWIGYALSRLSGTDPLRAGSGTGSTRKSRFSRGSIERYSVNSADRASSALAPTRSSAHPPVERNIESNRGLMTKTGPVSAGRSSESTATTSSEIARITVIDVETQPVYDLSVKGSPEFFANGVLVHNCFDSAKYFSTLMPDLRPLIDETTTGNPIHLTFTQMMEKLKDDPGVVFTNETWDTRDLYENEGAW